MIKLLKGAVFFVPVIQGDATSQPDGSSQNSELPTQPVMAKITSSEVYKEDLSQLEESIKAAETHKAISVFKQLKNLMVSVYVAIYVFTMLNYIHIIFLLQQFHKL